MEGSYWRARARTISITGLSRQCTSARGARWVSRIANSCGGSFGTNRKALAHASFRHDTVDLQNAFNHRTKTPPLAHIPDNVERTQAIVSHERTGLPLLIAKAESLPARRTRFQVKAGFSEEVSAVRAAPCKRAPRFLFAVAGDPIVGKELHKMVLHHGHRDLGFEDNAFAHG